VNSPDVLRKSKCTYAGRFSLASRGYLRRKKAQRPEGNPRQSSRLAVYLEGLVDRPSLEIDYPVKECSNACVVFVVIEETVALEEVKTEARAAFLQ
jgi:hypothetical protein